VRAQWAMNLTFFHWGIHAWVTYCIVGLLLGAVVYRKCDPPLPCLVLVFVTQFLFCSVRCGLALCVRMRPFCAIDHPCSVLQLSSSLAQQL
jgi:hypothetical protein